MLFRGMYISCVHDKLYQWLTIECIYTGYRNKGNKPDNNSHKLEIFCVVEILSSAFVVITT